MRSFLVALAITCSAISLTGCNEIFDKVTGLINSEQPSEDDVFKQKLKVDLQAFDRIRTYHNITFFELEVPLRKAADKNQSTAAVRNELTSFANALSSQNNQFKSQHFQTREVAKLRNTIMRLHYATIQIIEVLDNPKTVNARLPNYLKQQKNLINEYNKLRTETEAKL